MSLFVIHTMLEVVVCDAWYVIVDRAFGVLEFQFFPSSWIYISPKLSVDVGNQHMDLNASPLPEEDDSIRSDTVKTQFAGQERLTGLQTMDQDRRNGGSKRRYVDVDPMHMSQPSKRSQGFQSRDNEFYDRNSLPPGWLDCPPYGDAVSFLIPSKVPLGESFNDKVTSDKRYSPQQAIRQQRRLGRELGLVIDLTNTNRYYRESDWTKEGIEYVKIRCAGRDAVPDNEAVENFMQEVTRFNSQHAHSNKYVFVHCTHGHNRTGYMIVHFLIRAESLSVTEAINRFSEARPPGIYKQDYIDDLYDIFGEQKPITCVCPQTPEWKRSPDRDDDATAGLQDNDVQAGQMTNLFGESEMENAMGAGEVANAMVPSEMTNDDILGDNVPYNQIETMRQFCNQALKLNVRGRGKPQFPGSHPVSLSRDNLQLLRQRYYYATWKADGTRYMMLITWNGCYLIDRNFQFRSVELRFPCRSVSESAAINTHHYTLLDGEMIIDTDPSTHKQERRYLIYDLIAINKVSLIERPFSERWMILENEVIKPRNSERDRLFKSRNPYYRYDLEPFRVRRKDFYLLSAVSKLLKEFIPRLSHASDGLIFQGWDDPYVPRTHEGLLKWKYPEMNSVDFLFEVGNNNRHMLCLNERGRRKTMDGNRVVFRDPSIDVFSLSGKIIECSWDSEEDVWVFMRMRPDKSTPNEFITFKKVMRSIKDNITEEVVLNEINDIIRLPMYADRIKTDCRTFEKNGRRK
ncbi:mRNA-capping enzyme-like isoform X1 [Cynara cardunculus var. scolymus]|uniref:mRNA-capping enzyme-like isoform X1 n=2 Tax=Cynara cardunculus var. scolymus TaxID=59895 RepID=UPI000D624B5F|nr:mRNA-capping enzyme-like isoform X1 [Cynara cardunculus var. scolymus]